MFFKLLIQLWFIYRPVFTRTLTASSTWHKWWPRLVSRLAGFPRTYRFLELQEPDAFLFDETYTKED